MVLTDKPAYFDHFREVTYTMMNGVLEMVKHGDGSFDIVYANEAACRLLMENPEEATASLDADPYAFIYPADRNRVREAVAKCMTEENVKETYRVIDKDGQMVWVLAHFHSMRIGEDVHIVIIYSNISEMMSAQVQLSSESTKLLDIINSIPSAIAIFEIDDDGKTTLITLNDQMVTLADTVGNALDGNNRRWTKEELSVLFNQSIFAFCANSDTHLAAGMLKESKSGKESGCVFCLRGSSPENTIYIRSRCFSKPVSDTSRYYYITFEDFTKDKLQEIALEEEQELLKTLSYTDPLTKVKNRNSMNGFVIECRKKPLKNAGLLFADLNGLKRVNDVLGHKYGDEMIERFVLILRKYFDDAYIFRMSGDEFISISPDIDRSVFMSKMQLLQFDIEANEDIASVGYVWEETLSDLKLISSRAEQIMYVEKQRYYEKEKSLQSKHRPILLNSLLADFEHGRFKMYLQPKGDIESSKIVGAEALVRKIDETGRVVAPYEFIPQLEKERLIPKIDFYMLEEVCRFLEKLKKLGITDFKVSVNMSRVTLVENNYIDIIESIINRYDFNVSQLEFEITESNETMDNLRLEDYIRRIKSLGIGISLDDVGTEYSSLPMLLLDGIDTIKLDRSLIVQAKSDKARMMLKSIIDMCHGFGMTVIAEGVETDDIREDLGNIDCDIYQGYLLSKPISEEEFVERFI